MRTVESLALVSVFTALSIASDLALAGVYNVKLVFTLTFVAAYLFGFRTGSYIGILSEAIWGVISPVGFGGYIIPFTALGMLLYSAAGSIASRTWGGRDYGVAPKSLFLGATMLICAFLWDVETNLGTSLIEFGSSVNLARILATQAFGAPFALTHEMSDFLMGATLAPIIIAYVAKLPVARSILKARLPRAGRTQEGGGAADGA